MEQIKRYLLVLVTLFGFVFMPTAANADFSLLACDANGGVASGTLFDADPNPATGDPATGIGECQYANLSIVQHIFSNVICNFVGILNTIMDAMYCGMHYYLITTVAALVTLYLTVYGAQILMGTAQLSTRDALVRLLKISFIYVFATQSAYGISFIFSFFMGFINDASTAVMNTLSSNVSSQSDGVCSFGGLDGTNMMNMFGFLDYLVCHSLIGPASMANTKVQGLFLAMIVLLAPMTLMFQWWVMTTVKTLVLTLVAFLKALAIIAFLVTLSPVFLGFFLFQSTAYVFENWLRYMIAFSVQIVIILAIVVFWIMTINQFVGFFNDLSLLIFPYKPVEVVAGFYKPSNGWAICPPVYGTDPNTNEPTAMCGRDAQGRVFDANPPFCTEDNSVPPVVTCRPPGHSYWQEDNKQLDPPEKIVSQGSFLYYVFYHLITLLLISYAFSVLLAKSDEIAKSLCGPSGAPALVPGWGNTIGNANSFQAPASSGQSSDKFAADLHKMLGKR